MYMKKVLAWSVRCLIQMRSGGAVSPPQGPRLVSGGGKGAKSPESPKILHFALPKTARFSLMGVELATPRL